MLEFLEEHIISIIELILILLTVIYLSKQVSLIKNQMIILNNDNTLKRVNELDKLWWSEEMIRLRREVCCNVDKTAIDNAELRLMSFFEKVGLYYSKKILDIDSMWEMFSEDVFFYYSIFEPNIKEIRASKNDDTYYDKFSIN